MPGITPLAPQYVFDVRDYGARGDGSTDDSAAIQAAIDAAGVSGGVVRLPRATYLIGAGLTVDFDDVTILSDHATITTTADVEMLRLGGPDLSSAATYKRSHVKGQLTLSGAGALATSNSGLVIRNASYCSVQGLRVEECGGAALLIDAYGRGTQYNVVRNVDLESNHGGSYIVLRARAAGGYCNDNQLEVVRSHDNAEGSLLHMRLVGGAGSDGVNENQFNRIAVESLTTTDTLLSLEGDNSGGGSTGLVQANVFNGLRLDGTAGSPGTNTLVIDADSPANIFLGVTFDGEAPTDASGSSLVMGNRGSLNDPYIRLGHAGLGGADGYEIAVLTNSSARELTFQAEDGSGAVRLPAGTRAFFGDPDGGDVAPLELDEDQVLLRTLSTEAIGAGPRIKFEGDFSSSGDQDSVTLQQIAKGTAAAILQLTGGLKITSGIEGGLVVNEDGAAVDTRIESDTLTHALFVRGSTGKVGMNTSSPDEQLDVGDGNIVLTSTAAVTYGLILQRNGASIGRIDTGSSYLSIQADAGGNGVLIESATAGEIARFLEATGNVVFNEGGADHDFRVEGANETHLLNVDAGLDQVQVASTRFKGPAVQDTQSDTSSTGTVTIDWTTGNYHEITLTEATTFTFTAPTAAAHLTLKMTQDATGGWAATLPTLGWGDGITPRWSTGANDVDLLFLFFDGTSYHASAMVNSEQT